jgi:hypothetical protein
MAKAIIGAAMIAGAIVLAVVPGLQVMSPTLMMAAVSALAGTGVSMEASALAQALADQRGVGITTRQAAGLRQIIYGMQRVGGVNVYESTTGTNGDSGNYVYNYVIALAGHSIDSVVNLYLDGRQVFWKQKANSSGYHANVGCGTVSTPPTTTVSISGGVITGITGTGGSGFANVMPMDGYRVYIYDSGGGSGAVAWAYNSGTVGAPVWTVKIAKGGSGYTSATTADIQGAYTFGGTAANDQQDSSQSGYGLGYGIGPGGPHYHFSGKVYCEVRFGDQPLGDYMQSLSANDSAWGATTEAVSDANSATAQATVSPYAPYLLSGARVTYGGEYAAGVVPSVTFVGGGGAGATGVAIMSGNSVGLVRLTDAGGGYTGTPRVLFSASSTPASATNTPSLMGCAYLYLNVGYDTAEFANAPEVRVTVTGKNDIYDPRTGLHGYSTNWALQVADAITNKPFGLGDNSVNQAQLIAAANVCDEEIQTSQGMETNYAQHLHYDTSTAPGDALALMMPSAGGRLSRIGGEWYIWPAYWQGPSYTMPGGAEGSFTFDGSALTDAISWTPYRKSRELINRVNGTFVAPNSPYNVAGNLYDSNGWYYGECANLWPLAWQPTNYPQYACDTLHGYSTDVYLAQDNNIELPKELSLRGVISIVQAQRLAKIELLRNRQQGSGTFRMGLEAWQVIPTSVMQFTWAAMGWTNKYLEISKLQFSVEPTKDEKGEDAAPAISLLVNVQETDPSVYEWDIAEELTPYDVEASPASITSAPAAPTSLTLTDNASTAIVLSDGSSVSRILATWVPPDDVYVTANGRIEIQYRFYDQTNVVKPLRPTLAAESLVVGGITYYPTNWVEGGHVSGNATFFYINNDAAFNMIAVRLRAVRAKGAVSDWVLDSEAINRIPHSIGRPIPMLPIGSSSGPIFTFQGTGKTLDKLEPLEAGANVTETRIALQASNLTNHSQDDLGDGVTYARPLATRISAGKPLIDFSEMIHLNKTAASIPYASGASIESLRPAQAGADVTANNTAADTTAVNGVVSATVAQGATGVNKNLIPDSDFKFQKTYWSYNGTPSEYAFTPGAGYNGGMLVSVPTSASGTRCQMFCTPIPVVPGQTYTLSGWIDNRYVASGTAYIWVYANGYYVARGVAGSSGRYSVTFTAAAGETTISCCLDSMAITVASGSPPYLCAWSCPMLQAGSVATAYIPNLIDDTTGYALAGTAQVDFSSGIHLNKTLTNIADGTSRFAASEAGANVTAAHVLTSTVYPSGLSGIGARTLTLSTSYAAISGLAWTMTAASIADVFNVTINLSFLNSNTVTETVSVAVYVDGSISGYPFVYTLPTTANDGSLSVSSFFSLKGLFAGSHTISVYVKASASSGVVVLLDGRGATFSAFVNFFSSAICQRIY